MKSWFATALVSGLAGLAVVLGLSFALRAEPVQYPLERSPVVFVCLNGVSMSVWSAAYFNRAAAEHGLAERAVARATIPSFRAVPLRMRLALALDGFRLDGFRPRVIDQADVSNASLIVQIDSELPAGVLVPAEVRSERWGGFPPMREQYFPSRSALKERIDSLVSKRAGEQVRQP